MKSQAISLILCFFVSVIFAQENTTTITIKNARQTNYAKDEKTGNDTIILEGDVQLTVQKGNNTSEISANKIIYDRKTEMLYADGNVVGSASDVDIEKDITIRFHDGDLTAIVKENNYEEKIDL